MTCNQFFASMEVLAEQLHDEVISLELYTIRVAALLELHRGAR